MSDDELAAEGCGMGSAALALFGAGALIGLIASAGRTLVGLARLAAYGTAYPGHYHGPLARYRH